jgi:hypothetical protein
VRQPHEQKQGKAADENFVLTVRQLDCLRDSHEVSWRCHYRCPHNLTRRRDERLLSSDLHCLRVLHLVGDEERFLAVHCHRLHRLHDLEHSVRSLNQLSTLDHLLRLSLLLHLLRFHLDDLLGDRAVRLLYLDDLLLRLVVLQLDVLLREIDHLLLLLRWRRVQRLQLLRGLRISLLWRLRSCSVLHRLHLLLELSGIGCIQLVDLLCLLVGEEVLQLLERNDLRCLLLDGRLLDLRLLNLRWRRWSLLGCLLGLSLVLLHS